MSLKQITSGLTGNAWAELKSDNVIVFSVPGSPYRSVLSQLLSYQSAVIAVFRITSGFPWTSGSPEVTLSEPWHSLIPLRYDWKRVWVTRTSQFSPTSAKFQISCLSRKEEFSKLDKYAKYVLGFFGIFPRLLKNLWMHYMFRDSFGIFRDFFGIPRIFHPDPRDFGISGFLKKKSPGSGF